MSPRSADGQLHDHCFTFINAMAICFDLVSPTQARDILKRLERKRAQVDHTDFRFGVAPQLVPVPRYPLPPMAKPMAALRTTPG